MPEGLCHVFRWRVVTEELLEAVEQAHGGGVPRLFDAGAASDEEPGYLPAAIPDRVSERAADRAVRRVDVGAGVDERGRDMGVVAAGRPMQGRLVAGSRPGVGVGAG